MRRHEWVSYCVAMAVFICLMISSVLFVVMLVEA
jgi:hypothetical protein